jgi:dihydrodipicolinate synthase/N-acetylneuraminate lyase
MKTLKTNTIDRRDFLFAGAAAFVLARTGAAAATQKTLRGIFPIAQTPFTASNKLDVESLAEQVRFIHRGKVHGFVWPQIASEWETLTESERMEGAEAIASTGAKLSPAIVIGVQAPDVATAVRYAKHAQKAGADAVISLPPANQSDPAAILEYYKQVGAATELPLFCQAVGNLSVDSIISMYHAIPTLRYVKDEAGEPLMRLADLRSKSDDQLKIFTGGHGRTLIDEMIRGFSGSMPAASFADVYAWAWDLWHEGKRREAVDEFGSAAILINEIGAYPEGMKYILYLRGVFKTYQNRTPQARAAGADPKQLASGRVRSTAHLDETAQQVLRQLLDLMKPHLRV